MQSLLVYCLSLPLMPMPTDIDVYDGNIVREKELNGPVYR